MVAPGSLAIRESTSSLGRYNQIPAFLSSRPSRPVLTKALLREAHSRVFIRLWERRGSGTPGDVLRLIRDGRAATRNEVIDLTGLSRSTVLSRVGQLLGAGLLRENDDLVPETAPRAREGARVHVRARPAQEVAVPDENLHRDGS